ncbi:hypothetical protein SLS56_005504 [Neofusicoccum ribis]|uniref:NACHT domain-containing protein n=1 Tax=Neofusicoccum ribis TaxID=45134 RepID=A0ABR3ST94_9PEZI
MASLVDEILSGNIEEPTWVMISEPYFDTFSGMLCRFGDFLDALMNQEEGNVSEMDLVSHDWLKCSLSALLWCYGKAGTGKSVLASNVVETVKAKFATRKEIGICFTYCDYKQDVSQAFSETLLVLMRQLCRNGDAPFNFTEAEQSASPPSTIATTHHFTELAWNFDEVFLLINALDEYQKDQRFKIPSFLKDFLSDLPRAKIFITSRREQDIVDVFEGLRMPVTQIKASNVEENA